MSEKVYKGLIVCFALALSISVPTWLRDRQELQVVTAANKSLRKTLGDMTIVIAEKDREVDRLMQSPCAEGHSQIGPESVPGQAHRP
jgi:putative cell wall-binding protein